jgi:hypothetical protein
MPSASAALNHERHNHGAPVLFALPRTPSVASHTAADTPAPSAAPAKPQAPGRRTTPLVAAAADVAPSHELLESSHAPAEVTAEAATPAPAERAILPDAPVPPSVAAPAPRDRAPAMRGAEAPPATAARASPRTPAPQIAGASVAVVRPPPASGSVAPARIHIGTVEVRSHTPAPVARAAAPAPRRSDAAPISRGYAWHFGLTQG